MCLNRPFSRLESVFLHPLYNTAARQKTEPATMGSKAKHIAMIQPPIDSLWTARKMLSRLPLTISQCHRYKSDRYANVLIYFKISIDKKCFHKRIDWLWGLTRRRYPGDEVRRSGVLEINFDHLGIFDEHLNLVHTGVHAFCLHQKSRRRGQESNPHPHVQQHNALATAVGIHGITYSSWAVY